MTTELALERIMIALERIADSLEALETGESVLYVSADCSHFDELGRACKPGDRSPE
jgi:hypothetical protein